VIGLVEQRRGGVPFHVHCKICGRPIAADREYCSRKCSDEAMRIQQRSKRISRIYMLIFIILMILLFVWSLSAGRQP